MVSPAVRLLSFSCIVCAPPPTYLYSSPPLVSYYSLIATINLTQVLHSAGLIVRATCPEVGGNEYEERLFHISSNHHFLFFFFFFLLFFALLSSTLICVRLHFCKPFSVNFTHWPKNPRPCLLAVDNDGIIVFPLYIPWWYRVWTADVTL